MVKNQDTAVVEALASTFSRTQIEARAKRLGVVKCERKVDITNILAERLPAEEIVMCQTLSWQVELLFKTMKQHCQFDDLPSRKQHIVECLI